MQAKALKSFSGFGVTARVGDVMTINDEKVYLDLSQAGFVEQVDSKPTKKPRNE